MNFNFDQQADLVLVADIGGTQMRTGIVNSKGDVLERLSILSYQRKGIEHAVERLVDSMLSITKGRNIAGACVASAGPIDPKTGMYSFPPSLANWHGHSMKPFLEKTLGIPVSFGHDATLAALAEITFGKFKGSQHFIYITVSTGIGGGIITNGQMVTGANGFAGEVGHLALQPNSPLSCGGDCRGCFESLASGTGIISSAKLALAGDTQSSLKDELGVNLKDITTEQVFEHAQRGDKIASKVVAEVIDYLAIGISSLLNIFDPDGMTLGGGVMESMRHHWDELEATIKKRALPRFRNNVPVYITELGEDICMLGAAALAFRNAKVNR